MDIKVKTLLDKEDIEIGGRKFFISRIPAVRAQEIFVAGFNVLQANMGIPAAMLEDLLPYCGTYNGEGSEVQFANSDIINMFTIDPFDLIELEGAMIKKNFGFLFDGRGARLAKQMQELQQSLQSSLTGTSTPSSAQSSPVA